MALEAQDAVAQLFLAVLGRAPEYEAMTYFCGRYDALTAELGDEGAVFAALCEEISTASVASGEFEDAEDRNEQIVLNLYANVLGREAEPVGHAYWLQQLNEGLLSPEQIVIAFLVAVQAHGDSGDGAALNNRVAVARSFATEENSGPAVLATLEVNAAQILAGVSEDPASVSAALEKLQVPPEGNEEPAPPQEPGTPETPEQPGMPEQPQKPETPEQPQEPGTPEQPEEPETPTEPTQTLRISPQQRLETLHVDVDDTEIARIELLQPNSYLQAGGQFHLHGMGAVAELQAHALSRAYGTPSTSSTVNLYDTTAPSFELAAVSSQFDLALGRASGAAAFERFTISGHGYRPEIALAAPEEMYLPDHVELLELLSDSVDMSVDFGQTAGSATPRALTRIEIGGPHDSSTARVAIKNLKLWDGLNLVSTNGVGVELALAVDNTPTDSGTPAWQVRLHRDNGGGSSNDITILNGSAGMPGADKVALKNGMVLDGGGKGHLTLNTEVLAAWIADNDPDLDAAQRGEIRGFEHMRISDTLQDGMRLELGAELYGQHFNAFTLQRGIATGGEASLAVDDRTVAIVMNETGTHDGRLTLEHSAGDPFHSVILTVSDRTSPVDRVAVNVTARTEWLYLSTPSSSIEHTYELDMGDFDGVTRLSLWSLPGSTIHADLTDSPELTDIGFSYASVATLDASHRQAATQPLNVSLTDASAVTYLGNADSAAPAAFFEIRASAIEQSLLEHATPWHTLHGLKEGDAILMEYGAKDAGSFRFEEIDVTGPLSLDEAHATALAELDQAQAGWFTFDAKLYIVAKGEARDASNDTDGTPDISAFTLDLGGISAAALRIHEVEVPGDAHNPDNGQIVVIEVLHEGWQSEYSDWA